MITTTKKITSIPQEMPILTNAQNSKNSIVEKSHLHYSCVHAIPGRLRLKIPILKYDQKYLHNLETLLKYEPSIASFRINQTAASLVIYYQHQTISTNQIHDYLD